jgi:Arc/MetJ family transcription regulator
VAKTLIDIDERLLADAAGALGTTTKKETVNRALAEVSALAARTAHLRDIAAGGLPDLGDPAVMSGAWRE